MRCSQSEDFASALKLSCLNAYTGTRLQHTYNSFTHGTDLYTSPLKVPRRGGEGEGRMEPCGQRIPSGQILVGDGAIRNGLFHNPKERKNPSGHSKDYWHMRLT